MEEEEYMTSRIDDQIAWYNKKSATNRKYRDCLQTIIIILAPIISLIAVFTIDSKLKDVLISITGLFITILTSILSSFRFQEKWIEYRTTCEKLQSEKYLYLTRSLMYKDVVNPYNLFVERVENIIADEHSIWMKYTSDKSKEK